MGQEQQESIKTISDSEDMIHVKMESFGVTSANRKWPILETVGVGPCVAVAFRDPKSTLTGLIHISPVSLERNQSGPHKGVSNMLDVMIKNGMDKDEMPNLKADIFYLLNTNNGKIIWEKLKKIGIDSITAHTSDNTINIAIDSKSGDIYSLTDLKQLPQHAKYGNINPPGGISVTTDQRSLR